MGSIIEEIEAGIMEATSCLCKVNDKLETLINSKNTAKLTVHYSDGSKKQIVLDISSIKSINIEEL